MPSARVVKAFDVVEDVGPCFMSGAIDFTGGRSVFSDEKKFSVAELSRTFPARLIEQVIPLSARSRWNCSLVYSLDSTDCRVIPIRHQPYGLNFEFTAECPSRHIHAPVPSSQSYLCVHERAAEKTEIILIMMKGWFF